MSLHVHSIETFGTHEGPGIRLVIFLQGCHFRCAYCHNPDTWKLGAGKIMKVEEIVKLLEKEKNYLKHGGLTVSGGEPLIQREGLIPLFQIAKRMGIHTTLDTNGSILDEKTKTLLEVTDLVLLDVKHISNAHHQKLTGQSNEVVLEFAKYLSSINKPFWLRYVLVPGWTDQISALHQWGAQFKDYNGLERVEILPFHTLGKYKYDALNIVNKTADVVPPSLTEVGKARNVFEQYFDTVVTR